MPEDVKKTAHSADRLFCRAVAAWCCVTAYRLVKDPAFASLAYGQNVNRERFMAAVFLLFMLFSGIAQLLRRPCLQTDSWFLLGGATVCVGVWLGNAPTGENQYDVLFLLAVTLVYCLFVLYTLHANRALSDRIRIPRGLAVVIAVLAAGVSCAVIAGITCLRYKTFSSPNYDFGLFVNMFCNMKRTGLLLCRRFGFSGKLTVGVSLLYAFYPLLATGCFYDVHENCFLTLFLLLTFYFFEVRHPIPMFLSALLVLSVKEDAAIYLLFFALYMILGRRRVKEGIGLAVLAGGYFALSAYLLKTYGLGMMVSRFDNLIYDKEDGLLGAVRTALVNPGYLLTQMFTTSKSSWEKITYFCQLFLPLGMLPFCTKKASRWLLVAPVLVNFLTYYQYQYNAGFQYHFGIAAFLFYALILNLNGIDSGWRRSLLSVACACTLCFYLFSVTPVLQSYRVRWESGKQVYAEMEEVLDTIPADASVNCSTFLLAHIADREEIYELAYHGNKPDVDYVVIDARYSGWEKYRATYLAHGYSVVSSGLIVIMKR